MKVISNLLKPEIQDKGTVKHSILLVLSLGCS